MTGREVGLIGRQVECQALDRLIETVRAGESGSIVLRGDPGIGKSALLDHVADRAQGFRVERAVGIESELELAFAGLHQLCRPMLDHLGRLPAPQGDALSTAFGLSTGATPDRFLVGLAVLGLFAAAAEERPFVALIDDVQWLDEVSAQVLGFVARRVRGESVALVFAVRSVDDRGALMGLPELRLTGLDDLDAHALLESTLLGPMDAAVRERIVADSRGCPLALLELSRGLSLADLAGGFGLPSTVPLVSSLEQTYISRLELLSPAARRLLLVAALEPIGDAGTVWRAAEELGLDRASAEEAESSGLVSLDSRVRFRHPLVRSAVCRTAEARSSREVHRALADATDPVRHPDRRAWHRALAADGPDESIASELERCAGSAQERGGLAAAAAFRKAAVTLTRDPGRRASRAVAAAKAEYDAGASDEALALLAVAEAGPLDEHDAARAELLRGQIAFFSRSGRDAPPLLAAAARRWQHLDPTVARESYLDAISAGLVVGRFATDAGLVEVAEAARAAPGVAEERAADLLLSGFAALLTEGYAIGSPLLERAVTAFRNDAMPAPEALRWLWLATHAARDLWDDESWEVLATRHVRLARDAGALSVLPIALTARVGLHFAAGEIETASHLVEEIAEVSAATGRTTPAYGRIGLAAWRGNEAEFSDLTRSTEAATSARGDGLGLVIVRYSGAVLYNGRGRYRKALAEAESGAANPSDLCYASWSLVELIEAASRIGEPARAVEALERLTETTQASGTDWALGMEARSRALVSADDVAEANYREALTRLANTRVRMELARTHLLYGEWLRRAGRRLESRENLRTAHVMFTEFGAAGHADRARRELLATGERARKRTSEARDDLTAQEAQIAGLAAEGRTNPEIGAELFISARTVEWHLAKVFPKLGIASRMELPRALDRHGRSAGRR
jgi:DNA-binding CsgD family transcriptional regulator